MQTTASTTKSEELSANQQVILIDFDSSVNEGRKW